MRNYYLIALAQCVLETLEELDTAPPTNTLALRTQLLKVLSAPQNSMSSCMQARDSLYAYIEGLLDFVPGLREKPPSKEEIGELAGRLFEEKEARNAKTKHAAAMLDVDYILD